MRSKTDPAAMTRDLSEEERIRRITMRGVEGVEDRPLDFDPAVEEDVEHIEILLESHGFQCLKHRLTEIAVDANRRATVLGMDPLRAAWFSGMLNGVLTAIHMPEALIAEATGKEYHLDTQPTHALLPPRAPKAVAGMKPSLKTKTRRSSRRKSA